MKGVVFLGDRKLELREFPDPTPGPRDVILETKVSGMVAAIAARRRRREINSRMPYLSAKLMIKAASLKTWRYRSVSMRTSQPISPNACLILFFALSAAV